MAEEADLELNDNNESLSSVIRINVGGVHHETLLATLRAEESMLSSMFNGKNQLERDNHGCPFIDRPGDHFSYILNYLRDRSMLPPTDVAMKVYTESLYYQIPTLIERLETTPDVFQFRLKQTRKEKLHNYEIWKNSLIEKAQIKSQESFSLQATVNFVTSTDHGKIKDPCDCVLNEHFLAISGPNARQETFSQIKRRLEMPDIVIDEGPNFNIKLFVEIAEKELRSEGYDCKIWVENLKCLYRSNYTRKECSFEIDEYIAEFNWK